MKGRLHFWSSYQLKCRINLFQVSCLINSFRSFQISLGCKKDQILCWDQVKRINMVNQQMFTTHGSTKIIVTSWINFWQTLNLEKTLDTAFSLMSLMNLMKLVLSTMVKLLSVTKLTNKEDTVSISKTSALLALTASLSTRELPLFTLLSLPLKVSSSVRITGWIYSASLLKSLL